MKARGTDAGARERPLAPDTPVWVAARSLLRGRGDDFFTLLQHAGDDPRPVMIHDLRVASRRLRETLALFAPCYRPAELAPLRRQLRRITRDLGELRNADEALLFLRRLDSRLEPAGRAFLLIPLERCHQRRRQERQRLHPQWQKWREGRLPRRFSRAVRRPLLFAREPGHPAFWPMGDFARDALDPQRTPIAQLLPAALREEETAVQHRLRIAVKHLRYRGEILSFLFAAGFADLHGALKNYQEELGQMHDLDVFAALLAAEGEADAGRQEVLATLAAERHAHFQRFTALHAETPLPQIAAAIRDLLR